LSEVGEIVEEGIDVFARDVYWELSAGDIENNTIIRGDKRIEATDYCTVMRKNNETKTRKKRKK
jgi:hypothetical protein